MYTCPFFCDEKNCIIHPCTSNYFRFMKNIKNFSTQEALYIAKQLKINFNKTKFNLEQFRIGLNVELEHGRRNPSTNVTNDDPILTGKIALAHLNEFPDYYIRLTKLEEEARKYWNIQD